MRVEFHAIVSDRCGRIAVTRMPHRSGKTSEKPARKPLKDFPAIVSSGGGWAIARGCGRIGLARVATFEHCRPADNN